MEEPIWYPSQMRAILWKSINLFGAIDPSGNIVEKSSQHCEKDNFIAAYPFKKHSEQNMDTYPFKQHGEQIEQIKTCKSCQQLVERAPHLRPRTIFLAIISLLYLNHFPVLPGEQKDGGSIAKNTKEGQKNLEDAFQKETAQESLLPSPCTSLVIIEERHQLDFCIQF